MTTKPYSCWSCKYFKPDDVESSVQGHCHRFAPHALDYYGFSGIEVESPLTTKGDIYGYDTDDTRVPVGTDGQVLTADSTKDAGVDWKTPASGSSPLTTKGDLYGYDTADNRLAVGTDGQILIADSSETMGVKWGDNAGDYKILALQSSIIGTQTGTGETSTYREGNLPSGELPVSGQYVNYDTEGMLPFHVPPNAELVAVGLNLTKGAVGGASVGSNPYLKIYFYDRSGSGYTNLGAVDFPIPAAYVGYNNDVGTADYYSAIEKLATPLGPFPNHFLGLHVVMDTTDTERINAVHNCTITAYVKVPLTDIMDSSLLAVAAAAAAETETETETEPDLAAETESGTVLLSLTTGTTPTSAGKWSVIYDATVMWCGKYRKMPGTVPPVP